MSKNSIIILILIILAAGVYTGLPDTSNEPLNVIIIGAEFMRSDHLPCYGYTRNTTPHLCRFAANSTVFANAYAQAGWTHPSVGTLFTSLHPTVHGLINDRTQVHENITTLAEQFSVNNYTTVAFPGLGPDAVSNEHFSYQLLPTYNLMQGFDTIKKTGAHLGSKIEPVTEWLSNNSNRTFFMYIQGYDPIGYKQPHQYQTAVDEPFDQSYTGPLHNEDIMRQAGPFMEHIYEKDNRTVLRLRNGTTIPVTQEDIDHVIAHYDMLLQHTDRQIGALLNSIREQGLIDNTIIVFHSSHGVYLDDPVEYPIRINGAGQRVFGHAGVSDAELHVPLIMHIPDRKPATITRPAGLIDIMPTLLDLTDLSGDRKTPLQGRSLFSLGRTGTRPLYSFGGWGLQSVRIPGWKLIAQAGQPENILKRDNSTTQSREQAQKTLEQLFSEHRLQNQKLRHGITSGS